jgi:acetyl esterase/lipase
MIRLKFISAAAVLFAFVVVEGALAPAVAADGKVISDIAYKTGPDLSDYELQRCRLDLYLPAAATNFATLVWFHGGGMTGGSKNDAFTKGIARSFAARGLAVACASYRLSPKAKFPAYIEDAAAAVAWTLRNIGERGGDTNRVFVGGHSAGAYLTFMVGLDAHFLAALGVGTNALAGLVPVSGQTMTHFTVREERGLPKERIIADEAAPVFFVRRETPPMLVIMGGNDWPARAEENEYFVAAMKVAKNPGVTYLKIPDRTHGSIASKLTDADDPGAKAVFDFIAANSATLRRDATK